MARGSKTRRGGCLPAGLRERTLRDFQAAGGLSSPSWRPWLLAWRLGGPGGGLGDAIRGSIKRAALATDGRVGALADANNRLLWWEEQDGVPIASHLWLGDLALGEISRIALSASGRVMAVLGSSGDFVVGWRQDDGSVRFARRGTPRGVRQLALSADGQQLALVGGEGDPLFTLYKSVASSGGEFQDAWERTDRWSHRSGRETQDCCFVDGEALALLECGGDGAGAITLWRRSPVSVKMERRLALSLAEPAACVAFRQARGADFLRRDLPDIAIGRRGGISFWSGASGTVTRTLELGGQSWPSALAYAPDGERLLVLTAAGKAWLEDCREGREGLHLGDTLERALAISPQGAALCRSEQNRLLEMWRCEGPAAPARWGMARARA